MPFHHDRTVYYTVAVLNCLYIVFPLKHNQQVVGQNLTGIQWITNEPWTAYIGHQNPHFTPLLGGTLGFAIHRGEIPGLKEFLSKVHPENDPDNSHENTLVSL